MRDDYGYFGKGIDGYVHYTQAQGEGKRRGSGGGSGGGCLTAVLLAVGILIGIGMLL